MDTNKLEWDLEAILENKTLEQVYDEWKKTSNQMLDMYAKIFDSLDNFKAWINIEHKFKCLLNRVYNYISNHSNIDVTEAKWIGWTQKIRSDMNTFMIQISDYENRVNDHHLQIKEYLKDSELAEYTRSFDAYFRTKPHILSKVEEKLLSELSRADGGVQEIYNSLINSDIKYAPVKDSKNKSHAIVTMSDAFILLKSKDQVLRKNTWISFNHAIYSFRNALTQALYFNFLELNTSSKVHKFKDYVSACCFSDEINEKLIPHIYQQVESFKGANQQYAIHRDKLLKEILGINTVEVWDRSVDLCHKEVKFTIPQAQKLALEALAPLGQEYLSVVKKAFDEQWISWLPKENKMTGAYSIGGTKGLNKFYILMNYDKSLNAVSTLIHELGHSLNSYFFNNQKVYSDTTIFTAEIASITNEMLLNYYLLEKYKDDDEMQLMVLDELISGFFAATSRQIIFSHFEFLISQSINENKPVTYEVVEQNYKALLSKYIYVSDEKSLMTEPYKYGLATPLRISHFYIGNFYVYKYSIGQVVGTIIANRIINKHPGAIEKYMEFLKSGTSLTPIDTIKILDIDLYQAQPWQEAHKIMIQFINRFCAIKPPKTLKNK